MMLFSPHDNKYFILINMYLIAKNVKYDCKVRKDLKTNSKYDFSNSKLFSQNRY